MHATALRHLAPGISATIQPPPRTSTPPISTFFSRLLAESERYHPDIAFGWGRATVSLQTKKIKGLHKNDFIMAAKTDRIAMQSGTQARAQ